MDARWSTFGSRGLFDRADRTDNPLDLNVVPLSDNNRRRPDRIFQKSDFCLVDFEPFCPKIGVQI
jgi:hypothetical protein